MKALIAMLISFFCHYSYAQLIPSDSACVEAFSIEGVWELESFDYYESNDIVGSSVLWEGYRQIKIFQDGYIMWSRNVPKDSVQWYGFGTYELRGDTLIENLEYGSHELMKLYHPDHIFILNKALDIFRQIDFDQEGNYVFSENYRRLTPRK